MSRVLITGGSGFLGINLVRYLYKKGYDISVIDLVKFDYKDMKDKIKFLKGDIRKRKDVEKIMKGCDYVVHCAMALPLYPKEEIMTTGVNGTRIVLETAEKYKVKRVIHISTTAVYGIPDHHPLLETDKLDGVGNYGKAKILAEEVCLEFRDKSMIVPILRPKTFIGPERLGVFGIYYDWINKGKNIPIIGNGKNRYQLLDVEDLCEAIWLAMTVEEKKANDIFNIGAKKFTTMKEDFGAVLKYSGSDKKIISLPAKPVIITLRILELFKLSPLYKWIYETAPHDSYVSIRKAEKNLGFKPKYSNKEALIRNYQWYLEHKKEFEGKTGISHRVPWKQGILKIISWFF